MQDDGRTIDEHHAHHHQQQDREDQHHALRGLTQIGTHQLGQSCSTMTHGEHADQIVVHGTGEDASKHNPQIGHRTIPRTHDGTEDGSRAGNIQKLNHENLPTRKHDVVHSIGLRHSGRGAVVGTKHLLHQLSIEEITGHECQQCNNKRNHQRFGL